MPIILVVLRVVLLTAFAMLVAVLLRAVVLTRLEELRERRRRRHLTPRDERSVRGPSRERVGPDLEMTAAGLPVLCARCQCPIPLGRGRYRTTHGDVHEECYEQPPRNPKPPIFC